jgi:hypothetical protein
MRNRLPVICGVVSAGIPILILFWLDRSLHVTEDEFGVDHYTLHHVLPLHIILCFIGAILGGYAAFRSSRFWWVAVAANIVVLGMWLSSGNNF